MNLFPVFNTQNLVLILFLPFILTSCEEGKEDLSVYIQDIKSRGKVLQPLSFNTQMIRLQEFKFPENKKKSNPFCPNISNERIKKQQKKKPVHLQQYDFDALQFVGTFKKDVTVWALIKSPKGIIVPVKEGDYMGKYIGQVHQVEESQILIEVHIPAKGNIKRKMICMKLSTQYPGN